MAKSKFKVGDKVISREKNSWTTGLTGVVIPPYRGEEHLKLVLVRFANAGGQGHRKDVLESRGFSNWYINANDLKLAPKADTFTIGTTADLTTDINLPARLRRILGHLKAGKRITNVEGQTVYGEYRLSDVIHKLRGAGYDIITTVKKDEAGRRYSSYQLV